MLLTYPAVFFMTDDDSIPFYIVFPDVEGMGTQGKSITDGMEMASDYLGLMLADLLEQNEKLPKPTKVNSIDVPQVASEVEVDYIPEETFVTLVSVNLSEYLEMNELKKKTLTIPKWADKLGMDLKINFSQTLVEAIVEKAQQ